MSRRDRSGGITRRKVVVIAGNRREFEEFCRANRHVASNTVHADSVAAVRGLNYIQVYKTGGWYLLPGLDDIVSTLKTCDQVGLADDEKYESRT